ncbi:MAG: mechanosensitive ion channel family protein [Burkholderiaceae bacterium]
MNDALIWLRSMLTGLRSYDVQLFTLGEANVTILSLFKTVLLILLLFWAAAQTGHWIVGRGLRRFSFDTGTREAIGAVIRYLVLIIGLTLILQNAGINLTALSVVAGAIGVGVGFGLQNIVSNFISGLIIMLERPIKVGDRVELGTLEGTVREIRARRTTVVTNDNVAILIPNQRFIVDNVVNLAYLERPIRLRVTMGVAAGSDAALVERLLIEVASRRDDVLSDPPPQVILSSLGGAAMLFELAVWYSAQSKSRQQMASELNFAISETFRANQIRSA